MSLEISRLKMVKAKGGKFVAQCPACAENGNDSKGDHLVMNADESWGCVLYPGPEGAEHRKRINALAGACDRDTSRKKKNWISMPEAPENASFPTLKHWKHGRPSAHWVYRTEEGKIAFIVARFDTPGGKEVLPLSWCRDEDGNHDWRWKAPPRPRKIYGLPLPAGAVVMVEGEKCAEAVRTAGLPATTWQGGAGAVGIADFEPLTGKDVFIWPDNDAPGLRAKDSLVRTLSSIAARILVVQIPADKPEGWDAADATVEEIMTLVDQARVVVDDSLTDLELTDDADDEALGLCPVLMEWHPEVLGNTFPDGVIEYKLGEKPPLRPRCGSGEFYYNGSGYYLDNGTVYVPMNRESVHSHLEEEGYRDKEDRNPFLNKIQVENYVAHAGPIAGMMRGFYPSPTGNILVTKSPQIIRPSLGDWSILRRVIEGLLGNDPIAGNSQVETFYGWLKVFMDALRKGKRRPGQALALTGPRGCGKTLLIDIIETMAGGRRADPYAHFTGRTGFNGDLVGAELLVIDDEAGSTDIRARKHLAAAIKHNLFSGKVRIEAKYCNGVTCAPLWRLVIACNDEPEALLVLPPLSEDVADKIMLFKCHKRPLPMPAHTVEEKEAFMAAIVSGIPGFLHFLDSWEIPNDLAEERCGVGFYHHPDILSNLAELAPENALLNVIDTAVIAGGIQLPWQGQASLLRSLLTQCSITQREAEKLLQSPHSTGVYLGRLESTKNRVVKGKMKDGYQQWIIRAGTDPLQVE